MLVAHSHIQWGNVPAWVGSLLTGGSLLLGFYILLRDRQKEERAQATKVAGFWKFEDVTGGPFRRIVIYNHSDQPVTNVHIRVVRLSVEACRDRHGECVPLGPDTRAVSEWTLVPYLLVQIPFQQPSNRQLWGEQPEPKWSQRREEASMLVPQEMAYADFQITKGWEWYEGWLVFDDASGRRWYRNLGRTQTLRKLKAGQFDRYFSKISDKTTSRDG